MAQPCHLRPSAASLGRASGLKHVHIQYSLVGDVCRQRGSTCVCESWLRPPPARPAYNEYLSPDDIKAASAEHYWNIVDVDLDAEASLWTCLKWIPGFLRFHVIPLPLKFLFLVMWRPIRGLLFQLHKRLVLLLCQLDAVLSRKPKDVYVTSKGAEARFSRSLALSRLHCNRTVVQDISYWAKLLAQKRR